MNEAAKDDDGEIKVYEDECQSCSSDFEIGQTLEQLGLTIKKQQVGGIIMNSRRPNTDGGMHSRPNLLALQPLSNCNHKFSNDIRASP